MSASQDGSESVDQFLARIASVKETRDNASEERTRRMEEDFLKNRKERQARRLERARSLSPSKTGPSASTTLQRSPAAARDTALNPPVDFSPRSSTLSRSNAFSSRTSPKLEAKETEVEPSPIISKPSQPPSGTSDLTRSGTLSWQQRPPRDGVMNRPRPLSSAGFVRPVSKSEDDSVGDKPEPTRQQIAASLGAKDPTWFRQTQERGLGSAALRKNQVEDAAVVEHSTRSQVLPGMSKEGSRSATRTPVQEVESPSNTKQMTLSPPASERSRREPSPTLPIISDVPRLAPSPQQASRVEVLSDMGSSSLTRSGSILAGRPPSPTKGLGGFVESAMMKRSDSVNKRWSVQANTGLKRGDSVAGIRPLSGIRSMHASSPSRGSNRDGSPSPMPISRPESRDGPPSATLQTSTPDRKAASEEPVQNSLQTITRSTTPPQEIQTNAQLSRSPSKTLDSRRWSPTKSSWLESALNSKPESPKPQPKKEEVPAWKATLQRNKASRDLSPDKSKGLFADIVPTVSKDSTKSSEPLFVGRKPELKTADTPTASQETASKHAEAADEKSRPIPSSTAPCGKPDQPLLEPRSPDAARVVTEEKTDKRPPPVLKPKPQTPPKTDFRATLRSRAPVQTKDANAEPEFKSIFGKLKKAETQNYVAPDTLKDNILGGKAALSVTGGPQKAQRVDEFKESILQKKEAMKTSALQKKEDPVPDKQPTKSETVIPEALARRKTLHKSTPPPMQAKVLSGLPSNTKQEPTKPIVATKPKPLAPISTAQPPTTSVSIASGTLNVAGTDAVVSDPISRKPEHLLKAVRSVESTSHDRPSATEPAETQKPTITTPVPVSVAALPKGELPAGSKLASRLNPNLASLLTRGGSPHPPSARSPSPEKSVSDSLNRSTVADTTEESRGDGELTHMTKGRAKGPKRRAPKAQPTQAASSVSNLVKDAGSKPVADSSSSAKSEPPKSISSIRETFNTKPATKDDTVPKDIVSATKVPATKDLPSPKATSTTSSVKPNPVKAEAETDEQKIPDEEAKFKVKPLVIVKSPELRKVSNTLTSQQVDGGAPKPQSSQFEIATDKDSLPKPTVQPKPRELPVIPKLEPQSKPRELPITPKSGSAASPLTPSKSRVNTPKPVQAPISPPSKTPISKPIAGLGVTVKPITNRPTATASQLTPPPEKSQAPAISKMQRHNAPATSMPDVSKYFSKPLDRQHLADFDAQNLLLQAQQMNEKIKSLNHSICEVSNDGKKSVLSSGQEHILFEDSMYLITHSFQNDRGTKSSEAYLWCGDEVSEAAIEDAQLFCKKDAREHNAKLEVIKQGKEPASLFQALGGILITRRNKTSSLYMLRGRRHQGHIAFDEVDLTPSNLCSGFSYLISAKFGKLYLWSGKGSGADEIGCARLIGMDLGLTGEIEEVIEGKEPPSFWDSFAHGKRQDTPWAEDWQQRAKHNCYPTTLYRIDLDRPKSSGGFWGLRSASPPKPSNKIVVDLISPFCDRDLEPSNVYVLDAYRSIYVILNSQATSKSTEVVTALHLAQELAMLSPSVQDRSLLPSCHVVFEDPPADVKICFRKWSRKPSSNADKPPACHRLEDVMEALKL